MKIYSPKQFGKLIGKSVSTLQRWDNEGRFPAKRTITNQRCYTHEDLMKMLGRPFKERINIVYCRVSSRSQKDDLRNQKLATEKFCISSGIQINELIEEVGGGMNFERKKFNKIMERIELGEVQKLVIAHKDRLVRFGFDWFNNFAKNHGCEIVVINSENLSPQEELTQDLLSIIHCFSSRLYGLRRYKKEIIRYTKQKGE